MMKIIAWNCQGGFRLKHKEILELKPDILIVPECEQGHKLKFGISTPQPNDFIWHGDTGKKGVGIFSYSNYKLTLLKDFNPGFRYVIPVLASDGVNAFMLFAIWAMDNKQEPFSRYIGQVWLAIHYYQSLLAEDSILIGDFNSNQIWDHEIRNASHTDVVTFLGRLNIESLYHKQFKEDHGKESRSTFFLYRNLEKPYHLDYIFASHNIIKNGYEISLDHTYKWISQSDHMPIVLDVSSIDSKADVEDTYQAFLVRQLSPLTKRTLSKFKAEITLLKKLAEALDRKLLNEEKIKKLLDGIGALKQIDKLVMKLK